MYRRLHELAAFAEHKRVRLMVDAEQTYVHLPSRTQKT